MNKFMCVLLAGWIASPVLADDSQWHTSFPQAADQALRENKLVLLDFTGSDWCGWCKKLDAETLSQAAFLDFAGKNLVLVKVDFSRSTPQSAQLKQANNELKGKFGVDGYPTLVAVAPDGAVVWKQRGYRPGGPAALIAGLNGGISKTPLLTLAAPGGTENNKTIVAAKSGALPPGHATAGFPVEPVRRTADEPKLQGIFYSSHPSVILNGKSCEEGESVNGMRVLKIDQAKVVVEWKGESKELTLQ
jgi:thiol-disulfide isomerase/thioredoxin